MAPSEFTQEQLNWKYAWDHPVLEPSGGKHLLDRMGGLPNLEKWVHSFYDAMLKDKAIGPFIKRDMKFQDEEKFMLQLKNGTIQYLEAVWGGDPWEGQSLFELHASLHIGDDLWDRSIKCAMAACGKLGMSSDVKKEIESEMEVMREPCTDTNGKFHRWIAEKNKDMEAKALAEGAVDVTGMGFTVSIETVRAMAAKAEKAEERKQKMLEARKMRQAQEKAAKELVKQHKKQKNEGGAKEAAKEAVKEAAKETQENAKNTKATSASNSATPKAKVGKAKDPSSKKGQPPAQTGEGVQTAQDKVVSTREDDKAEPVKEIVIQPPSESDESPANRVLDSKPTPLVSGSLMTQLLSACCKDSL